MALKPCRGCGEQVSTDAEETCPNCGKKNPTRGAIQSGREAAWLLSGATVALVIVTPLLAIATFRLVRAARSEPRAPSEEVSDDAEALP